MKKDKRSSKPLQRAVVKGEAAAPVAVVDVLSKKPKINVGDVVAMEQDSSSGGVVIAVHRHDHPQGDLIVYREVDGSFDAWFSKEMSVIARGSQDQSGGEI